jgi:hypothetical protein
MFEKLTLQKVRHSSGYVVTIVDRFHVAYEEGDRRATADVEFGPTTSVFVKSLTRWEDNSHGQALTSSEIVEVADRIKAGLDAMGDGAVELVE